MGKADGAGYGETRLTQKSDGLADMSKSDQKKDQYP